MNWILVAHLLITIIGVGLIGVLMRDNKKLYDSANDLAEVTRNDSIKAKKYRDSGIAAYIDAAAEKEATLKLYEELKEES